MGSRYEGWRAYISQGGRRQQGLSSHDSSHDDLGYFITGKDPSEMLWEQKNRGRAFVYVYMCVCVYFIGMALKTEVT